MTGRLGAAGSARAAGSGDGDTAGGLWRLGPGPGSGGRRRPGGLRGRAVLAGAVGAALVAVAVLGVLVATAPTPAAGTHRAVACVALPYQPCGAPPAPHTDGAACDPGWYDLDGSAADGCEARSDYTAGTVLTTGVPVRANLVPVTMADTFTTHVAGDALALCWGSLHVTLTAPPGTAEELTVRHGGTVVGRALSAGGTPATATVSKPSCLSGDSEDLTLVVRSVAASGPATAADFTLTRDGGW